MKSLYSIINESVKIKSTADFKKDIDLKIPSGTKFKDNLATFRMRRKNYEKFEGFESIFNKKYNGNNDNLIFLGSLKDESGVYSTNGGETIRGSVAYYDDYVITTDSGNMYLYREVKVGDEVCGSFKLIDDYKKEPMNAYIEFKHKLKKILPWTMEAKDVLKKHFKIDELTDTTDAKATFPGPDGDIKVEVKKNEKWKTMFDLIVDGKTVKTDKLGSISTDLTGDYLGRYIDEVAVQWYKEQIKN